MCGSLQLFFDLVVAAQIFYYSYQAKKKYQEQQEDCGGVDKKQNALNEMIEVDGFNDFFEKPKSTKYSPK
jgi:hypothetical protein